VDGSDDNDVEIRSPHTIEEMTAVSEVLRQIWGSTKVIVSVELMRAVEHAGGYVAAAFVADNMVGASFGFLARHEGRPALHSHITGILPGAQHAGVGRAMKGHQRDWAAANGIEWVTWTFDPIVRRNAWFNIEVLGARPTDYLPDFYGSMADAVNADDESDRVLCAWPVDPSVEPETPAGPTERIEVATPEDIVVLRRTDPAAAEEWRRRVRRELGDALAAGAVVTGFTREGSYILERPI
jgi:predicted GNAT superfamily acetyltransferase